MGVAESLEAHFNTFLVNGGVATIATVASTAADAGSGDQRDENIREINNLRLDISELNREVSDLIATLRRTGLIQSP